MFKRIFGTDGIRGMANSDVMTVDTTTKLGMAAGSYFTRGAHRHRVIIGKDTRLSGYMFESALTAGFLSVGMDVFLVGPMPTPAIAMLTRSMRADIGVMISASHNPYYDNGIKLFRPDGQKLSDAIENEIEKRMQQDLSKYYAAPEALGRAKRIDDAPGRYIEFVKNTLPKGMRLDGLKIVIDSANGAAYHLGSKILWELGADVVELGVSPDGFNINKDCGSTSPNTLCQAVIENKADIGIALDGDADRVIIVDEKGVVVDGDQIIAAIATHYHKHGMLKGGCVVATIMSNLGLEKYLQGLGIELVRTKVGDRNVALKMQSLGSNVGGEQSGHVILSDYITTGDGLITSLKLLSILREGNQPISQVCQLFKPVPQREESIRISGNNPLDDQEIVEKIEFIKKEFSDSRIVVRKSGTESMIRVMVEAPESTKVDTIIEKINSLIGVICLV
jgi:phosphoglucosamine mutase